MSTIISILCTACSNCQPAEYKSNPELNFVKPDWKGNIVINGRFQNGTIAEKAPFWEPLKWKLSANPQRREKSNEVYRLPVCYFDNLSDGDGIIWLGHSTFIIQINGVRIITDPVFGNIPATKRKVDFPCNPDSLVNIDYMLVSHDHRDHFDKKSINRLMANNPDIRIMAPLNAKRLFDGKIPEKIQLQEAGWYQEYKSEENIRIIFLPARHWGRRGLNDFNKTLWGSFLIISGNTKIFFAGDSAYDDELYKDIHRIFGDIDICLLPIGSYAPQWFMSKTHMNPEEAMMAFTDLGGQLFIPMHYGAFDMSDEPLGEPIKRLRKCSSNSRNMAQIKELTIGEKLLISEPHQQEAVSIPAGSLSFQIYMSFTKKFHDFHNFSSCFILYIILIFFVNIFYKQFSRHFV
ncbi:MAG: MBL fold metallo-hydrolase [Prevotellaceae bacterium]|jgi:L-ascorbate metabolism protein UlaG (beta-lactamase superfamily)|nr:MBL fold metallo-hydrolase [Prevotellaceae bacterium]